MKERNEKIQTDEIIKEETNIFWWIRRDLATLMVETSAGMGLSFTPVQGDKWEESIHDRLRAVAYFLKTQSALLPPDDRTLAVITYKKLNELLWNTKESTSQYAKERVEITNILTDIQKAILLVHNKTPIIERYHSNSEVIATVRDKAISALSSLVSAEDKEGYHQKLVDIFMNVIDNKDKERWSTVHSAILGLWPFIPKVDILIELLFHLVGNEKITYDELSYAEAAAVALKNQAICLSGRLNEHRSKIEKILNSAHQDYLEKKHALEENPGENEDKLKPIKIICHCLDRCLEEIEQVKIQEEKARRKMKKPEKKVIKMQHPVEIFIDKEALTFISLLIEEKEDVVEHFLKDPRHLEMHLSYVQRCIEIINDVEGEKGELGLWLDNHPSKKEEILSFFKKMEDELNHRLKHKLSCLHVPKGIREKYPIAICPVCGMDVDEEKVEQKVEYKGIIYYFCCVRCKTVFEKDPARYHQILRG